MQAPEHNHTYDEVVDVSTLTAFVNRLDVENSSQNSEQNVDTSWEEAFLVSTTFGCDLEIRT
jgi:hypothetical protein